MAKITNELRESMIPCISDDWLTITKSAFERVADRIDEAYKHAIGYVDDRDPETMAENGWVKLPVDADGVPIRLGDEMECGDGTVFTVENITLYTFGWRCDGDGIDGNGYKCTAHPMPDCCRHHHAPTIEDVLGEIVSKCQPTYSKDGSYTTGLTKEEFAEYAAKLRAIIEGSKGPEWQETVSQDEER